MVSPRIDFMHALCHGRSAFFARAVLNSPRPLPEGQLVDALRVEYEVRPEKIDKVGEFYDCNLLSLEFSRVDQEDKEIMTLNASLHPDDIDEVEYIDFSYRDDSAQHGLREVSAYSKRYARIHAGFYEHDLLAYSQQVGFLDEMLEFLGQSDLILDDPPPEICYISPDDEAPLL